ncbi:hypothetical protein LTR15_011895 [Elasticomyces elasticus]|nr:hypothetical protein LTR15_011895 [Elasticomyces elasticus]
MWDIIRDSSFGLAVRGLVYTTAFSHPEERSNKKVQIDSFEARGDEEKHSRNVATPCKADRCSMQCDRASSTPDASCSALQPRRSPMPALESGILERLPSCRNGGETLLVGWYTDSDPANPQGWSSKKKVFVSAQMCLYTFTVYTGSSLFVAGELDVGSEFHVGATPAELGLALYVLGYGIGPMIFSPLSEIPYIGRNTIYICTYTVFVALSLAASLVDNLAGLLVLRFLLGFFGSPCLATGGATLGDMYAPLKLPYAIAIWAGAANIGPALGPVLSSFAVAANGWRWGAWELLWMSGPVLLLLIFFLPETSQDAILLRRARRLRQSTSRDFRSGSEVAFASQSKRQIASDALIKPWQINFLDPSVLFTTIYASLIYAIYYSFFEAFPLVYPVIYGFDLGQSSLPFLVTFVSLAFCIPAYCAYFALRVEPLMKKQTDFGLPEARLIPGVIASFSIPIGCFIFGNALQRTPTLLTSANSLDLAWSARLSVHWMIMQSIFLYLPSTYPKYSASLFAANDFVRSSLAAAAILFSRPMFLKLGVSGGVSLLGGLAVICVGGMFTLYYGGAKMRARSRFAVA